LGKVVVLKKVAPPTRADAQVTGTWNFHQSPYPQKNAGDIRGPHAGNEQLAKREKQDLVEKLVSRWKKKKKNATLRKKKYNPGKKKKRGQRCQNATNRG